jgi:hypothetical protein
MVAPPSHDLIIVSGTDGLVHHHRLATEHGGSSTLAYVQFESAEKVIVSGFDRIATGVMERKKKDVEIVRRTANHQLLVATYGFTILAGSTTRSNSSSVTKPSFSAAAFNVRSLSIA